MNSIEIEDFLKHAESIVKETNGELSPPDLNILQEIETSTTDSNISERIREIRSRHDYWVEHYELPENWESNPNG
jgi:hypothetical protein